jgi:glycosyltransferase involved in cell wall biosynthesis
MNAALSRATGDYAFWLDADDVIDPSEREKLRALLGGLRVVEAVARNGPHSGPYEREVVEAAAGNGPQIGGDGPHSGPYGYVLRACDPRPNGDGGQTVLDHI